MVVSNPAVSEQTGWPIGFWWAELTHPYWVFTEAGHQVTIASPDGGALQADGFSDPQPESGCSASNLISLGFTQSPAHAALVEKTPSLASLASLEMDSFDARFLVGGQRIQPFWIEDEARKPKDTTFITQSLFRAHALRDGNLITGQQQFSGSAAAGLVVEALGR
ncbi:MAG: hypothetical protein ABI720_11850 [Actinomycetes bacterium]